MRVYFLVKLVWLSADDSMSVTWDVERQGSREVNVGSYGKERKMKRTSKGTRMLVMAGVMGLMLVGGCNSTVLTYQGEPQPLERVAVVVSNQDTCPIFTVDNQFLDIGRGTNSEFHLLPGTHTIEVFYRTKGHCNSSYEVRKLALEHNFAAGHVYSVNKTYEPATSPKLYPKMKWTPHIEDLGEVVAYARQNPKYHTSSRPWKTLRKENGLTPSFFDMFRFAKKPAAEQVQEY